MLKIVHFTNTYAPIVGGIEKSVAQVCADLTARGHFCRVITHAFEGAERSGQGVLRLPSFKNIGDSPFSLRIPTPSRIDNWLEAIEPDVLHAHQPFMLGDTAWRMARKRHLPIVFSHHTLYERYSDWPIIDREDAARLMLSITAQFANRCEICIAPTQSVADLMKERGITRPIKVVPTGIDLTPFAKPDREKFRNEHGIPLDAPAIGHLGRITVAKNIDYLMDVAIRVLQQNTKAYFIFVGEGEAKNPGLEKLRQEGVEDRVVSCGNLHGQEVANAYAAMDLFLFGSKTDTQGLVLAEAMAARTPVVALDAPGARDCIVDGESGVLVDSEAPAGEMAKSVQALLEDPQRIEKMSEAALRRADEFEHVRCSQRFEDIYTELQTTRQQTARQEHEGAWDAFMDRMENEWLLLREKFEATRSALS